MPYQKLNKYLNISLVLLILALMIGGYHGCQKWEAQQTRDSQ